MCSSYILDYAKNGVIGSIDGLPNTIGGHDEDPEMFPDYVLEYAKDDLIHFVGGRAKCHE